MKKHRNGNNIEKIVINKVTIGNNNISDVKEEKEIPEELKTYLSSEYGVEINNIIINNK